MASDQNPAQRELALVGKVEMRIALADTDAKLTTTLNTYLAPLLLKLASEHAEVRNKVISICQHVNTRIKPVSILLPVAALIQQFKDQQTPLVRHFDLLYIQQGIDRLSTAQKSALIPIVMSGFSSAGSHASQIFNLLLRLLEHFTLPPRGSKEDVELRASTNLSEQDATILAEWLGKLILFGPGKIITQAQPGLSADDVAFLSFGARPDAWLPSKGGLNILRTKILAARLLSSGLFTEHQRFLPALFASADAASTISDVGDDMLKRATPVVDLEEPRLVRMLFDLYLGLNGRPPVSVPLRIKILALLLKSVASTSYTDEIIKLCDDGTVPAAHDGEDTIMSDGSSRATTDRQSLKLRAAVFEYINFVARHGPRNVLYAIAPAIVNKLKDFIEHQGWPKIGSNEDIGTRAYAYEVIGLLIKAGPPSLIFEADRPTADLLRWLFTSLALDSSGATIIVSIEQGLSTVLGSMSRMTLTRQEQGVLEDLLLEQMALSMDLKLNKRLRSTRYTAVRFANRCLPFDSVKARCVDLLGICAQGERMEVKEECERGLNPYWYQMLKGSSLEVGEPPARFPSFTALVEALLQRVKNPIADSSLVTTRLDVSTSPNSLRSIISFLRRVLYAEALASTPSAPALGSEWERKLDALVENDVTGRDLVKAHMKQIFETTPNVLELYQLALLQAELDPNTARESFLVEHLALSDDKIMADLVSRSMLLLPIVLSNDHNARLTASHAWGILTSHPAASSSEASVAELSSKWRTWESALGAQVNQVHGSILALGYYYSLKQYRATSDSTDPSMAVFAADLVGKMIGTVRDNVLKEAVFIAIGQLALFDAISLPSQTLRQCVDKIQETAKTGGERAILCLGQMCMVPDDHDETDSDLAYIENKLHDLHEVKQAEIHFTVGEAFTYLAAGWQSCALTTKLGIDGPLPASKSRTGWLAKLTDRFVADCSAPKPSLKKAAVMWLLCLVQYCGHLAELQAKLPECQLAFKRCLVDRDELVQETASRGLGLVYEKGSRSLKDDLVRDLVSSFSSDKQTSLAGSVSNETQLFEPGALPTGDGSVSTYKDIMSLASEVGDSSLVYRFMSMASSNAIWSSRAAFGRFGLSNVLSDASADGYLADNPKLYPKLYRYRFDPNTGVRRSMNDIWNALVSDSAATIDKHFDAILTDLMTSILGKEWRTRQASCAALADLLQGRRIEQYEDRLEEVWDKCFKVLDDIKESVRAAAASLARTLTGILTRALEADHSNTKAASAMLKHVLPFLLSPAGLESSAKEVQMFAVQTMLEIIKKANAKTLRPFIPDLVERLIGLLSSMEHEAVNYIHLNASKYNLTEQKIDDMRLTSVRSSPLMEAIERCLDLLDDETMQLLRPRLEHAMKTAVGLPSKVGAGRVLVSLCTRRTQVFKPHADHFLKVIEKHVQDRNETVSSSYAASAGYIARYASEKAVLGLVAFAKKLYFNTDGDRDASTPRKSITSGEIVYAIAKQASDRFSTLAVSILPFVFVAKHDSHEAVKEQFQNTWNDTVGGSRAVQLYLQEIVGLVLSNLDSPQWTLKHTAARSIADATISIADAEKNVSQETASLLWPAIEKALAGKTWDGKDVLLRALVKFVESADSYYSHKESIASSIIKIALREARRNSKEYRVHALHALARIASIREDIDISDETQQIVAPLLDELDIEDPMEVDEGSISTMASDNVHDGTLAAVSECLFATVNAKQATSHKKLQDSLQQAVRIQQTSTVVQKSTFQAMADLFDRLAMHGAGIKVAPESLADKVGQVLFRYEVGSEANRLLRADCLLAIGKASPRLANAMREVVAESVRQERSSAVRDRLATLPS